MTKVSSNIKVLLNFFGTMLTGILTVVFLSGCGSSESDPLNTGFFVDSPVQGLEYQSGSKFGITDNTGKFYYTDKDSVIFTLGGLEIGRSSAPKEIMTPIDLVDDPASFVTHPTVTNICRLLQSLDVDGNPENGIFITKTIRDAIELSGITSIDFSENFETQANDLLTILNSADPPVFEDGDHTLVNAETAQKHLFAALSERNATPVVMINLGDGFINGTKGGFGNVHQNTQTTSFPAYTSYQLATACDLIWVNPLLEMDVDEYDQNGARVFYRIKNSEDSFGAGEEYVPYNIPTNLGVDGATLQSLVSEKTGINGGNYSLLNELMLPVPLEDYKNEAVSQLDAALYVAGQYQNRLKLFTVWIGAEDTLGAVAGTRSGALTEAQISSFLNDAAAGRSLAGIQANFDEIVQRLGGVDYSYIFIATIPHVETIGALYGKEDIETLATFEGAAVTAMLNDELIGYNPFVDKDGSIGVSAASALDTDNATLNAAILQTMNTDANFLNETEIDLINTKIDAVNNIIKNMPDRFPDINIYVVDLSADIFEKLIGEGIEIVNDIGDTSHRIYKTFGKDKGFYSADGYYPSNVGNALISHEFFNAINDEEIGMEIKPYDIVEYILPVDFYNTDKDGDGFVVSPGFISGGLSIPQYDADQVGGWIDCNDNDEEVLPNYVSGGDCD